MITAFMAANELHVVHVIQQKGMTTIQARSICSAAEESAGPGVYQVPDWAFDGRPKYAEIPVCAKCAGLVARLKEPPPR